MHVSEDLRARLASLIAMVGFLGPLAAASLAPATAAAAAAAPAVALRRAIAGRHAINLLSSCECIAAKYGRTHSRIKGDVHI